MPLKCTAKFRYRQEDIPVEVNMLEDGNIHIKYEYPVKAVTPGQVAVLYQDEVCLGGAIIKSIEPLEKKYAYLMKPRFVNYQDTENGLHNHLGLDAVFIFP